jgi:hypothetical protein
MDFPMGSIKKQEFQSVKYIKEYKDYNSELYDREDIPFFADLILATYHKEVKAVLGEGGNGIAFDLGDSVVKITSDRVEVKYAKRLIDINSDHLVKVYDVREVTELAIGDMKRHMIHQEKLETNGLNSTIKSMIFYIQSRSTILHKLKNDIKVTDTDILELFKDNILSLDDTNKLYMYREIEKIFLECKKYGLPIYEISEKNVGVRDRKYLVYFDISDPYELN